MTRLFIPSSIQSGLLQLNEPQSHYVSIVLRKKSGDTLCVFNQEDGEWMARIETLEKRFVTLYIQKIFRTYKPLPERWLAFALLKHDAMTFLAEKITELGVTHVQPLITERTQIHRFSKEKFQKQMIAAVEQCERLDVPTLFDPRTLYDFCHELPQHVKFYAAMERYPASCQGVIYSKKEPLGFTVGPEGGFSPKEKDFLLSHENIQIITCGPFILRAETASLYCLARSVSNQSE